MADSNNRKSLLDHVFPRRALVRGGHLSVTDFEHVMGGFMVLLFALLTKLVHDDFIYGEFFVSFMMLQCSVTGFSPPCFMATYVIGLQEDRVFHEDEAVAPTKEDNV